MERKRAIEILRKEYDPRGCDETLRKALETLIPELAENEDERIRAVILKLVLGMRDEIFTTADKLVTKPKVLAWLKKQKEQKPVDYDAELKKCKDNPLYFFDKYVSIKIKQKPAEWSEEDEKMRNLIVAIFEVNHPDGFFKANELGTTDMRGVHTEEIISWLKSLRPVKQEWSEEEYGRLFDIKHYLDGTLQLSPDRKIACIDFLKSLRPVKQEWDTHDKAIVNCIVCCLDGQFVPEAARKQALKWFNKHRRDFLNSPSWKPSEEQMEALEECGECKRRIKELYEQLKKLI